MVIIKPKMINPGIYFIDEVEETYAYFKEMTIEKQTLIITLL